MAAHEKVTKIDVVIINLAIIILLQPFTRSIKMTKFKRRVLAWTKFLIQSDCSHVTVNLSEDKVSFLFFL